MSNNSSVQQHDASQCSYGEFSADEPDANRPSEPDLHPRQLTAIDLLLQGLSDDAVAQHLQVHRTTIYRWRTGHEAFQEELDHRRRALFQHTADRVRSLVDPALNILAEKLNDPSTSLRAAATLLRLATSSRLQPPNPPRPLKVNFETLLKAALAVPPPK